jgi:uncharacterized protein (UPF0335 family)
METRSSDEIKSNIESFAKRLINLLLDKKEIDSQIKDLKQEFKEEGVPVSIVVSALNKIKTQKKKTDSERLEEDTIK